MLSHSQNRLIGSWLVAPVLSVAHLTRQIVDINPPVVASLTNPVTSILSEVASRTEEAGMTGQLVGVKH
jgi:hypothetical protein